MAENFIRAGKINGNPCCGLDERICIQVKQITDGCIYRDTMSVQLQINGVTPSTAVFPYTLNRIFSSGKTIVSNLQIIPQDDRSLVSFVSTIPLTITFFDNNGVLTSANSSLVLPRQTLLRIPQGEEENYEIEVATNARSRIGYFTSTSNLDATVCVAQIARVVQNKTVVIPSYGQCEYRECEFDENAVCPGINAIPQIE